MQCSLIQGLILYGFELGYTAGEAIKEICCVKDEGTVDHSAVIRCFKKFGSGCKNLNNQASLKLYFEAMISAIDVNLVCCTQSIK